MATVKFRLVGKNDTLNIYIRILNGRKLDVQAKTELFVDYKDWQTKNNLPKQNTATNKNLTTDLLKLKAFILDKFNDANSEGIEIKKDWLKHNIDVFFKRVTENKQSDLLLDAIQSVIDEAPTRKNSKGGIGLSTSRVNAYNSLKNMLTEYQKQNTFKGKIV